MLNSDKVIPGRMCLHRGGQLVLFCLLEVRHAMDNFSLDLNKKKSEFRYHQVRQPCEVLKSLPMEVFKKPLIKSCEKEK